MHTPPESPSKRLKVSPSTATPATSATPKASALLTAQPALLENIIRFIPTGALTSGADCRKESAVLHTIAALCSVVPDLRTLVGPSNEAFWRDMVLAHFDFATSGDHFNVEDWGGDFCIHEDGVNDECDDPEYADWHRHPMNGPHDEWRRAHPDEARPKLFLVDAMEFWPSLGTYFKPSAYGFLERIQQDRSLVESMWPNHEDAFSLFCDVLLLPRFQSTDAFEWETWSDGQQLVYPCLMGRFPTKIVGRGYAMLKFCNFAPYFWDGMDEPVSARWSGLAGPSPSVECTVAALKEQKKREREARTKARHDDKPPQREKEEDNKDAQDAGDYEDDEFEEEVSDEGEESDDDHDAHAE